MNARGISLLEILIVVTIIGILATIGTPILSRQYIRFQIETNAIEMASGLDLARQYARSFGEDIEFGLVEAAPNGIVGYQIGKNLQLDGSIDVGTEILDSVSLNAAVSVSANSITIADVRQIHFRPVLPTCLEGVGGAQTCTENGIIRIRTSAPTYNFQIEVFYFSGENQVSKL